MVETHDLFAYGLVGPMSKGKATSSWPSIANWRKALIRVFHRLKSSLFHGSPKWLCWYRPLDFSGKPIGKPCFSLTMTGSLFFWPFLRDWEGAHTHKPSEKAIFEGYPLVN